MRKVELFAAIQLSTLLEIAAFVATGRSGPKLCGRYILLEVGRGIACIGAKGLSDNAAADADNLPGHPSGVVRNEKRNHVRDVARSAEPAKGRDAGSRVAGELRDHCGIRRAGRNGVYRDVARTKFLGENLDELFDRGLARCVQRNARASLQSHVAGNAHDASAIANFPSGFLKYEKCTSDID